MKISPAFCCAVMAALLSGHAASVAQPATRPTSPEALPDGSYMYCDPARAYYPNVETCPANWRTVMSPTDPNYSPVQGPMPDASGGSRAVAPVQAQVAPEIDYQSRAIAKAKSKGYEVETVKDLILDGKELAARNAKVQVIGIYKKVGGNAVLYASQVDAFSDTDNYMPVLTEDAAREVRASIMDYRCERVMCLVNFGGHMTMCQHMNLLAKDYPDVPCLHVEVQIVYRPGD